MMPARTIHRHNPINNSNIWISVNIDPLIHLPPDEIIAGNSGIRVDLTTRKFCQISSLMSKQAEDDLHDGIYSPKMKSE